jgi:hypothetical protein
MKHLLCTLIFVAGGVAARGDILTITFDQPDQTGSPGQTLSFFGTLVNNSPDTVFLNSDDLTLNGLSFTVTDNFFTNVPISLAPSGQPGDSSGNIDLFDVAIANPLLDPAGTYSGSYTVLGGANGSAQDVLGSAGFSVTSTPEPSSVYLLLAVLAATLIPITRKRRKRASDR